MTTQTSWVEIACDESGFSGTNLLHPASPVITHASVDLTESEAADVLAVLRSRRRRTEYKSNHLLRPDQRPALDWLLAALLGRAHVAVIDKVEHVAARVVELLVDEPSYGAGTSLGVDYSEVVDALRLRPEFLTAFVAMVRTKRVREVSRDTFDRFFAVMPGDVPVLRQITRERVEAVLARLIDEAPEIPPPLEPLVPALAETVLYWSAGWRSVAVVHDEQSALTRGRVARLAAFLAGEAEPAPPPLRSFRQVDSRDDPRVQVADLLAGVTRRRSSTLEAALEPYLRST